LKKRVFIIILIIILLVIPFFFFKEEKSDNKIIDNKREYYLEKDNINEYIKEELEDESIYIVKEISKEEKFKYFTNKYDNINEYIKEKEFEEEKIKYICVRDDRFVVENNKKYFYENGIKVKGLKLIDDIRYYFDFDTGELIKENVKSVIDISSWQGNIDFEKIKESNLVDAVIVRIGYGTTDNDDPVLDSKFKQNIEELKRLDIPFSVYIFGYAQNINASNKEVNFINDIFNKYNISKDTFIWYDAELTTFNNFYYSKPIYNLVIDNFVFKLKELGFNNVGLYGNLYMLTKGSLSYEKKYPVWVAEYNSRCNYEEIYIGWQYTSSGYVDGIEGRVDLSIFY
jgi:GH25 family lysozyme M1 (1,4-beta-N-acetylmuramidase)